MGNYLEKISKDRVKGFLRSEGRKIVNGEGEEILLVGWGLGNWLLNEGYMWKSFGNMRFDRPRRIEAVIEELTGKDYKEAFYKTFHETYVTEADIMDMAELGYNSVRIPINWRLFMEEGQGINFKDQGFRLLDNCIDWCEKHRLYAFIDLHGAPGGQTGANIDDCIDDVPRLFMDQHHWDQGIALWKEIAYRYKDRYIVGGYDLLNEPIRPAYGTMKDYDYMVHDLRRFYEEAIKEIRQFDKDHMFSIEGHHWSTNTEVFDRIYDPNMVIHFHRYGCNPDYLAYEEFLELSEKLNLPLWLGETGENTLEWFSAMYPLALDLGFGYNLWPAKKMDCNNSPYSIKRPKNWERILDYLEGGPHPGYDEARAIFDEYLENIKLENCDHLKQVTQVVFRLPGTTLMGVDFDELPGPGISYKRVLDEAQKGDSDTEKAPSTHRNNTGMDIVLGRQPKDKRFGFDCGWDDYVLRLNKDEFVSYSFYGGLGKSLFRIYLKDIKAGHLKCLVNDREVFHQDLKGSGEAFMATVPLQDLVGDDFTTLEKVLLKLQVIDGLVEVEKIEFR